MLLLALSWVLFRWEGLIFQDIHTQNKLGVRAFRATKCKKYLAGKFTRAAHLWREITQIEFRVKRWHKKYEILNKIESHKFGLNYVLIKSNRTALQTYKVEERTFGTPCIAFLWFSLPSPSSSSLLKLPIKKADSRDTCNKMMIVIIINT